MEKIRMYYADVKLQAQVESIFHILYADFWDKIM